MEDIKELHELGDAIIHRLNIPQGTRHYFNDKLVERTAQELGLALDPETLKILQERLRDPGVPLRDPGRKVLKAFQEIQEESKIPQWIDKFVDEKEIEPELITPSIKKGMTDFFLERGVKIREIRPTKQNWLRFEDQVADAFHYAYQLDTGKADPVDGAFTGGAVDTWNFTVDIFDDVGQQEILPTNIRASGALFYIYYLGERMGIFNLVDVLVLDWAAGRIDVVDGEGVRKLYRYWKLREQRMTVQERMMVYRRILNLGDGEVLSRMTINEHFPNLWQNLMAEVAEYIDKYEISKGDRFSSPVSTKSIELAARDLAYNLTEYTTGMVHMQVREMYAQLQRAIEILRDDQVLAHFGGTRRKTLFKVIETLAKQEYRNAPNIAAIRTLAIEGYKVMAAIADNYHAIEAAVDQIVKSGESWIIAASAEEESGFINKSAISDTEEDEFDTFEDEDEKFEEFESDDEDF